MTALLLVFFVLPVVGAIAIEINHRIQTRRIINSRIDAARSQSWRLPF